MASPTDDSLLTIKRRLLIIPTKLYDKIFDLVLTPASTVTIDKTYKPPPQIHISRSTRVIAATRYYTNTAFIIHAGGGRKETWLQWLTSIPKEHALMMRTFYKLARKTRTKIGRSAIEVTYWDAKAEWSLAAYCGRPVQQENTFVSTVYKDDDRTLEEQWQDGDPLEDKWVENGSPCRSNRPTPYD